MNSSDKQSAKTKEFMNATESTSSVNFKNYFDKNDSIINLNHGTLSCSPRLVINAKIQYIKNFEQNPTQNLYSSWNTIWQVQKNLSHFLNADPKDLFLRTNVTLSLNDLIMGIPVSKGEIAYLDIEYGAIINICRLKAKKENLSLNKLNISEYLMTHRHITKENAGDIAVDWILENLSPQTKLLLVSHVVSLNGLIIPIEKLSEETFKRGIYLVVDGAHATGAIDLDFSKLKYVDAYAGNLHKWFMAPKGTGFGWLNKSRQEELVPLLGSWTVFETPPAHSKFGDQSRFACQMLQSHSFDFSSWYAIQDTLDFWSQLGKENIRFQIRGLINLLRTELEAIDWKPISPRGVSWGPLLAFEAPEVLDKKFGKDIMFSLLNEYGIQTLTPVSPNQKTYVRFSPHIINTEEEIHKAVKILKQIESLHA